MQVVRIQKRLGYLFQFVIRKQFEKGTEEFTDILPFTGKRHTAKP